MFERVRNSLQDYIVNNIINNSNSNDAYKQCDNFGFLSLLKQSKLYWICSIITAALCYGFTLTNYTYFVDDLMFETLFKDHLGLAAGRWGYVVLMKVFNTLYFLPYWRVFIGVSFILTGATIFCGLYRKYSNGRFDSKAATIFTCVAISFPWIAELFFVTTATIGIGFLITLTAISLFFTCRWIIEKKHFLNAIPSVLVLGYAIAFYEPAVVLYLSGCFTLLLTHFLFSTDKTDFRRFMLMSVQIVLFALVGIGVWRAGVTVLQNALAVLPIEYISHFTHHNTSGVTAFFETLAHVIYWLVKHRVLPPIDGSVVDMIVWFSTVLLVLTSTVLAIVLRKSSICLAGVAAVFSSYGMYFVLGTASVLNRIAITFFLPVAFTAALIYIMVSSVKLKRIKLKYLVVFAVIWVVFIQSREMNQVYLLDYQRYQRDVMVMHTIVHDLGYEQEKPVIFVGYLPDPLPKRELAGISLFNINRMSPTLEVNTYGIEAFFRVHSFSLHVSPDIDVDFNELRFQIADMPSWPRDGYIREYDDYTIVRLGSSNWD